MHTVADPLQSLIENAFDDRLSFTPEHHPPEVKEAVIQAISLLDSGERRVAEKNKWRMGSKSMA